MSQIIYGNQVNSTDVSASVSGLTGSSVTPVSRVLNRSITDAYIINSLTAPVIELENVSSESTFQDFNSLCVCGLVWADIDTIVLKDTGGSNIPVTINKTTEKNRKYEDLHGFGILEDKDVYILYDDLLSGVNKIIITLAVVSPTAMKVGSVIVGNYKEIDISLKGVNISSISTSQKKYSASRQLYYTSNPLVLKAAFSTVAMPSVDVWGTTISSLSNINYSHDTTGLLIFILTELDNICLYGTQTKGMAFKVIERNDDTGAKMWQVSFDIEEEL
jgi:hypothetical protein